MRSPFISLRRHEELLARQQRAARRVIHKATAENAAALRRLATELSNLKDEVALHIVAAKHPSSEASSAHAMAISLEEALAARGIDLRIELGRLEGSQP